MEQNATIEKIHSEFFQSFEKSETELIDTIDKLKNSDEDQSEYAIYSELSNVFTNSSTVNKANQRFNKKRKTVNDLTNLEKLQQEIEMIKVKYPYKIISYGQIIKILDKYNLFIAESNKYTGIVPAENAKQIINYRKNVLKQGNDNIGFIRNSYVPISSQNIENMPATHAANKIRESFFICGASNMFKKDNTRFEIGREICYDPNMDVKFEMKFSTFKDFNRNLQDPIVLYPIFINNPIAAMLRLFHVVTAWGPESREPEIFNEQLN